MRDACTIVSMLMLLVVYMELIVHVAALSTKGWLHVTCKNSITALLLATLGTEGVVLAAAYVVGMGWLIHTFPYRFDAYRQEQAVRRPDLYSKKR